MMSTLQVLTRLGKVSMYDKSMDQALTLYLHVVQEFILARDVQLIAADDIIPQSSYALLQTAYETSIQTIIGSIKKYLAPITTRFMLWLPTCLSCSLIERDICRREINRDPQITGPRVSLSFLASSILLGEENAKMNEIVFMRSLRLLKMISA